MIIGVALVVDELHKGQRLVFRYPEAQPSFALFSGELMTRFHEEYLALAPDNFARLFRPKPAFFNNVLDITIGDINYISYPAPCLGDAPGTDSLTEDPHGQSLASSDSGLEDDDSSNVITLFTVVVARVREGIFKSEGSGSHGVGVDPISTLMGLTGSFQPISKDMLRKYSDSNT